MSDSIFDFLALALQKPSVLKPQQNLLLLSHMRANTSLIGHILGSHEQINGYYEMHIGYYSYKSRIRQKLKYFSMHKSEPVKPILFDKVLHNEHDVTTDFMLQPSTRVLMCVREPIKSVQSIVALYEKNDPTHEFATQVGAARYYLKRCLWMLDISKQIAPNYLFYKAEDLIQTPQTTLAKISDYLSLQSPLTTEFKTQKLTGKGVTGDNSGNLDEGKIIKTKSSYAELSLPDETIAELHLVYQRCCEEFSKNAVS